MALSYALERYRRGFDRLSKDQIKIAAASVGLVIGLVLIGFYGIRSLGDASEQLPHAWICADPACGNRFSTEEGPEVIPADPNEFGSAPSLGPNPSCPKCGKADSLAAYACPQCGEYIEQSLLEISSQSTPITCPKCQAALPKLRPRDAP